MAEMISRGGAAAAVIGRSVPASYCGAELIVAVAVSGRGQCDGYPDNGFGAVGRLVSTRRCTHPQTSSQVCVCNGRSHTLWQLCDRSERSRVDVLSRCSLTTAIYITASDRSPQPSSICPSASRRTCHRRRLSASQLLVDLGYGGRLKASAISSESLVDVAVLRRVNHSRGGRGLQQPVFSLSNATCHVGGSACLLRAPRIQCAFASSSPSSSCLPSSVSLSVHSDTLSGQLLTRGRKGTPGVHGRQVSFSAVGVIHVSIGSATWTSSSVGMGSGGQEMKEKEADMPRGRFAVLVTGYPPERVRQRIGGYGYDRLFIDMLSDPGERWDVFHVAEGQLPSEEDWDLYDGFVITGSGSDAHGPDPWIERLAEVLAALNDKRRKMLGVCFGHQVLGRALGGVTGRAEVGWEVGMREVSLEDASLDGKSYAQGLPRALRILQVHRDQVKSVPPGAQLLGSSSRTPVEMFAVGDHVLAIQGHPEFTKEIVEDFITLRVEMGIIPEDEAKMGRESLKAAEVDTEDLVRLCKNFLKGSLTGTAADGGSDGASDAVDGSPKAEADRNGTSTCQVSTNESVPFERDAAVVHEGTGGGFGSSFNIGRLEAYTEKVPMEVLSVQAEVDGEEDEVIVFRGYSSSLMRATSTDPSEPVLPPTAIIKRIDKIKAPYNPSKLVYIQQGLTWDQFQKLLSEQGL